MEELSGTQNLIVGVIAGTIQCGLDHPLISLKNMTQQKRPISFHPRVLYRGVVADTFGVASLTAIQFYGTGAIRNVILWNKRDTQLSQNDILLSSFGGGMLSGIVCSPWELIMIQQQQNGGTLWNHAKSIARSNLRMFSRAVIPSMGREGVFTMGYLGITPILERHSHGDDKHGVVAMVQNFGCAMISGVVAVLLSNPFDTVNTLMKGDIHQGTYKGVYHSFHYVYTNHGIGRFYSGATFRFGCVATAFFVFNRVMEFIAPKMYPHKFQRDGDDILFETEKSLQS